MLIAAQIPPRFWSNQRPQVSGYLVIFGQEQHSSLNPNAEYGDPFDPPELQEREAEGEVAPLPLELRGAEPMAQLLYQRLTLPILLDEAEEKNNRIFYYFLEHLATFLGCYRY